MPVRSVRPQGQIPQRVAPTYGHVEDARAEPGSQRSAGDLKAAGERPAPRGPVRVVDIAEGEDGGQARDRRRVRNLGRARDVPSHGDEHGARGDVSPVVGQGEIAPPPDPAAEHDAEAVTAAAQGGAEIRVLAEQADAQQVGGGGSAPGFEVF